MNTTPRAFDFLRFGRCAALLSRSRDHFMVTRSRPLKDPECRGRRALGRPARPAEAALQWHSGTSESSYVLNCGFAQEPGIQANAEFQSDPQALPRVGEVFYVRSVIARIGDGCGIDMLGHVEIVPPPGVTTAIWAQHPVRCQWLDITTGAQSPAGGCPQEAQEAVYGPGFDQLTPGGSTPTYPWRIAYQQALVIEVPLRSNRGLQGTSPTCIATRATRPARCRASRATRSSSR